MKKALLIVATVFGSIALMNCSSDDNKGPKQDCFDCEQMGVKTKVCYTEGDDFYTATMAGQSMKQPLGEMSWKEMKEFLKEACSMDVEIVIE